MTENHRTEPSGPIEAALVADLEAYQLEKTPNGRTLAAAAMALAQAIDREPNAAAAKELRLFLAALGDADAARPDEALENLLAELAAPIPSSPPVFPTDLIPNR